MNANERAMSADLDVRIRVGNGSGFTLDVAFDVPAGITVLFGPSGSGKSTTLAAIAGLVTPAAGKISLGADVWFDADLRVDRPTYHRKIAFVFQSLALFPHLTAIGNVTYGMDRRESRDARSIRAAALLDRLHVGHLEDRKPPTFSGGEAQRVALARAFAMAPRAVLMDEPFSAMDHALRKQLAQDVRGFVDELGVPMLFVTHHRNEARALGDRVLLIEAGRIVGRGSADEMIPKERGSAA